MIPDRSSERNIWYGEYMSIPEIVPLLVSFLLGMCVMAFAAYIKAERRKRVLQEDVSRLADGKLDKFVNERGNEELPHRKHRGIVPPEINKPWEVPPAAIKKPRVVSIEKRECRFDEKRQRFVKYCTLLDEFHRKNNEIFTLQFHPIMNRFLASNSVKNETDRNHAIVEFNREVQLLFNQLYEEQQKVNSCLLYTSPSPRD